jgi:acetyl-CoA C-acetyltransferase
VALDLDDVDIVELNEAFAAQVLPVCRGTGIDIEGQLNPHGGAIRNFPSRRRHGGAAR